MIKEIVIGVIINGSIAINVFLFLCAFQQSVRDGPGKPPPDKEKEESLKPSSRYQLETVLARGPPYPQVIACVISCLHGREGLCVHLNAAIFGRLFNLCGSFLY